MINVHQSLSIANTLNIYFCDIGSELASALPRAIASHRSKSYLNNYSHKLKFNAICELINSTKLFFSVRLIMGDTLLTTRKRY